MKFQALQAVSIATPWVLLSARSVDDMFSLNESPLFLHVYYLASIDFRAETLLWPGLVIDFDHDKRSKRSRAIEYLGDQSLSCIFLLFTFVHNFQHSEKKDWYWSISAPCWGLMWLSELGVTLWRLNALPLGMMLTSCTPKWCDWILGFAPDLHKCFNNEIISSQSAQETLEHRILRPFTW